jgi:hypothetical protein
MQFVQLVSSFSALVPNLPAVHCEHEFVSVNGATNGLDMKEPAGQQPRRAVLDPKLAAVNALVLSLPDKACH